MRAEVNEPRNDNQPGYFILLPGPCLRERFNGRNMASENGYGRPKPGVARSIQNMAASNEYVVRRFAFRRRLRLCARESIRHRRLFKSQKLLTSFDSHDMANQCRFRCGG